MQPPPLEPSSPHRCCCGRARPYFRRFLDWRHHIRYLGPLHWCPPGWLSFVRVVRIVLVVRLGVQRPRPLYLIGWRLGEVVLIQPRVPLVGFGQLLHLAPYTRYIPDLLAQQCLLGAPYGPAEYGTTQCDAPCIVARVTAYVGEAVQQGNGSRAIRDWAIPG